MKSKFAARTEISINVPVERVWEALTKPQIIEKYMFGSKVATDWKVGSQIVWKGMWQGKTYEDKGAVLRFEPRELLSVSHFGPLSRAADRPENYHILTYELFDRDKKTFLILTQDNNAFVAEGIIGKLSGCITGAGLL